ncbi:eukaryotic translation initiation factor 5B-like [Mercenaria mercenaria]|uniref:eukaryotic translation initiation factor 5B-like n=1 Tax=Mercenaria mercenaria TaxID=6596 RepID=UPI00234F3E42|nr:eukaryotic translation initiation factor 5B-like [Mercenaria mercenaria]
MGKPKNKVKDRDVDSDIEIDDKEETEAKPAGKQSKKDKRKKKKDDDWEDDVANELESLSLEANKGRKEENTAEEEIAPVKKKEKKKKKKQVDSEGEEEEEDNIIDTGGKRGKKMTAFNMLMMEDDDETKSMSEHSDNEEEPVEKQEPSEQQKKKDKKKEKRKGKDKQKTAEEEDLDALLAEIDKPKESKKSKKKKKQEAMETEETSETMEGENEVVTETAEVEKVEPKVVTIDDYEDDEDDKKKKKKKKDKGKKEAKEGEEGEEEKAADGEGEEEGGTVKSAAQKKKEKKEKERLKKLEQKKKQALKKEGKTEEQKSEDKGQDEEQGAKAEEKAASGDEEGKEEEEDSKKKKKKKKGEKEEKPKKSKAPVAAIKELLKRQKEEEERLKREEEERIRKEEEAIAAALEKKRLEEEKRKIKKQKEKERKERLKAEGKLLTAQQKQEKLRQQQMLESMKAQGLEIKQKDEDAAEVKKKRPIYEKKKKKPQQKQDGSEPSDKTPSPDDTPVQTPVSEESPQIVETPEDKVTEGEASAAVEDTEVSEDIKDEWDISSEEEEEEEEEAMPDTETKVQVEVKDKKTEVEEEEDDEEEESDDEDDEDDDDDDDDDESETESESDEDLTAYERAEMKIKKRHEKCEANRSTDELRAPVVCVLGHVDTGKTKILDKLRRTNVQDGEAGGITQQIGATNVPHQAILDKTTMCKEFQKKGLQLPGLLIIDTPGHESFSNLRSRGSSLCDIAILVIDIMHGLEPQTIESINLLKEKKTPFVVALNKIDRLYQWKSNPNSDVVNTIKKQTQMCKQEYDERSRAVITQLAEQGLNAALFYENKNPKEYISLIPTSAHSGDGMGNLLSLICELTQTWLAKKVSYSEELQATVMEVKAIHGLGTTIDVILVNGKLCESDQIVIAGTEGPIVTWIRGLLMPQPMKELRVKAQYEHHKEVKAAQGVKIIGKDLEKALAGLPLYVAHDEDEIEYYKEELSEALKDVLGSIKLSERGVFVQASTLGSLEALLEFLRTSKIPYAGINIGPVHKKDIMKASIMLEHDTQWAVILAFDVKVERDAQEMADSLGVRIFTADIIYHLQDAFLKFRDELKKQKQEEYKNIAVFPCKLRVLPQFIFNSRDPIVVGVSVEAGLLKHGTPVCVPSKEFVFLGIVNSIEVNHKPVDIARKGQEVCIKIENVPSETPKLYGRHFDHTDILTSRISRASIDAVKDHFREEMTKQDWALMVELKKLFQIL